MRLRLGLFLLCLLVPGAAFAANEDAPTAEDWAIHGQATGIEQYHPAFRSAYRGPNSLDPGSRGNETVNLTAYAGARVWDGGEAWADLEMDQGFGLSNTLGVAAFTNGEGSKVGKAVPYLRLYRLFFRQSFDLGGEAETLESQANQLAGSRTADNVTSFQNADPPSSLR
jgi:high affinity Mn2+ porin